MKTENSTRFGFAQTVITPDAQAVYLDGFGERITPAEGVRDPLYVKAFGNMRRDAFGMRLLYLTHAALKTDRFGLEAKHREAEWPDAGLRYGLCDAYAFCSGQRGAGRSSD